MNNIVTGENGDDDDDDQDENGASNIIHTPQSSVPLVVSVSKGSGPMSEFSVMAYPDEILIDIREYLNWLKDDTCDAF
ncbi:hypothetical protein MKX01_032395 [Papaver californicum]|nr:hypothetical protein MKX01_032395 [Papaver californicum]